MTDKNHELYLEDIETAIAKTTKELMDSDEYNLRSAHESRREAFRKIAEQDVEIQRLRKYKTEDNKTIRNLRSHLQEATEEIECRVSTWESKEGEYQEEIRDLKVEIEDLKEESDECRFVRKQLEAAGLMNSNITLV
tara:strand:+ start:112 stop:522 length:411 start_codon:yes stop_codon:yes gene_type:complete